MRDDLRSAVVLADTDGIIRHWSPDAEVLFGYTRADAEGESLDLIVPDEYREQHWTGFHRAMATGECRLDRAATNIPVRCRDGEVRVFPGRFVFLIDARDQVVGAMAIYAEPQGDEQPWGTIS